MSTATWKPGENVFEDDILTRLHIPDRGDRRYAVDTPSSGRLLIVEALTEIGDDLDGTNAVRSARARRLARDIAAEHGLDVGDALFQIDYGPGNQQCSNKQDRRGGSTSGGSTIE